RVRPPLGAGGVVVRGGDAQDVTNGRLVRAGRRAQDNRVTADRSDAVVVQMLVGDEQQVGAHAGDRGIVPAHAARAEGREVVERVDEDGRVAAGEPEGGLPVP